MHRTARLLATALLLSLLMARAGSDTVADDTTADDTAANDSAAEDTA